MAIMLVLTTTSIGVSAGEGGKGSNSSGNRNRSESRETVSNGTIRRQARIQQNKLNRTQVRDARKTEKRDEKVAQKAVRNVEELFPAQYLQLTELRTEAKEKRTTFRALNKDIRVELAGIRESLKGLSEEAATVTRAAIKARTELYRENLEVIRNRIELFQEAKQEKWLAYDAYIKASNTTAAEATLKEIVALRTQINSELDKLTAVNREYLLFLERQFID